MTTAAPPSLEDAAAAWQEAASAEYNARRTRDEAIRAAHAGGMTAAAIGRAAGLDRNHVWRIVHGQRGTETR